VARAAPLWQVRCKSDDVAQAVGEGAPVTMPQVVGTGAEWSYSSITEKCQREARSSQNCIAAMLSKKAVATGPRAAL
jgi:hypothetical protein